MSNTPLETVEEHDYLGVRLHHKLSWGSHINHIYNKVNRMLNRNLRISHTTTHKGVHLQDTCVTITGLL